ncbi:tetratricopeptide repeat protein [Mucilaginibacter segetis]|uniref:Tetratricopeptide repeat protein n=1 Tax=Mucilaginibacter segetis TaxID=2793071 RepID=A0A934PXE4_9SPHI|nr:tetratricopeptide repeat protein [Mucilaginibacter segetis]MBK0381211.1 tetratricopeptide repeat protein [Mucilaginibacter segetis]
MRFIAVIVLFTIFSFSSFAQNKLKKNNNADAFTSKGLSNADSGVVRQLYFSALREKTIENFRLASDLFTRVLQIDPANDASMYELANLQKIQKNYADAVPLLERAVTISPDNEWYWLALADGYEKTNNINKLENVFDQLIRLDPKKPDYYFDKANVYLLQKKYDEALKLYDQVELLTGPSDELLANKQKIYLRQGNINKATDELEKMIAEEPSEIKYYIKLADVYNSNDKNDKAQEVIERAQKIQPDNGILHLALADIYRDKKKYEDSFNELEKAFADPDVDIEQKIRIILGYLPQFSDLNAKASALQLSKILTTTHPDNDRAFAMYGDMLLQNGKYSEAKAAYKKAIALNGQVYATQEQLVRLEIGDNDIENAIKDGENALSYFPNQASMNYLVGVAWQQAKDYNKALSYLKNALALEPADKELLSQCYSSMGDCYHAISDNAKSDEAYDKALTYDPDNAYTLNNYAYYLSLRNEKLDKAEQMSKHSNVLQENSASFEDTYAWILFKQKNYREAKVWIERSLQHDKTNSSLKTEHYGDILYFLGETDGAVKNWIKAKAQGEQSPVLEQKINERKYIE